MESFKEETFKELLARHKRENDALDKQDADAREAGTLIGRYIQEPVADGYGVYVVVAIKGQIVTLDHVSTGDGWAISFVENMDGKVPLKYVKKNIEIRDRISKSRPKLKPIDFG